MTTALRSALLGATVAACNPSLGAYESASQGAAESASESDPSEGTADASSISGTATSGSSTSATSTSGSSTSATTTSETADSGASTSDASPSTSTSGAPLCPDCDALCSGACVEIDPLVTPCDACQDCGKCGKCPDCPTCMNCAENECGVKPIVCIHSLACPALTASYDAEIAGQAVQDFGAALRCVACHLGSLPKCQDEESDCRADATCDAQRQCVDGCACLDGAARARCEGACPDPDDPRWLAWRECDKS